MHNAKLEIDMQQAPGQCHISTRLDAKITACAIGCEFDTITKVHYYVEKMETSCYCVFRLLNDEYNAKDQLCAVFGIHCIIICIEYK